MIKNVQREKHGMVVGCGDEGRVIVNSKIVLVPDDGSAFAAALHST